MAVQPASAQLQAAICSELLSSLAQMDMIDLINDEFGTTYEDDTPWAQVLLPSTLPRSPAQAGLPVGECHSGGGEV